MEKFAQLFSRLEATNKTNEKLVALVDYFEMAPDADKLWCIALFSDKRPRRPVKTTLLKQWAMELTQIPEWLFLESYSAVGDLGETLSLLLPPPVNTQQKPLHLWIQEIVALGEKSDEEKKQYVTNAWKSLDTTQRLIFNKLIGGSFRVGVSRRMLVNALSRYTGQEASALMHSIMGNWSPDSADFNTLINGENVNIIGSRPYPFCLAYPLEGEPAELGDADQWQAEYKWDGIRGQVIKRNNEVFIWSRGEELITHQFPELEEKAMKIPNNFVLDGEILAIKDGNVLNFNELQKRLNRKTISRKLLQDAPAGFYAYDLLEWEGEDLRDKPLVHRRSQLEGLLREFPEFHLSGSIPFQSWDDLAKIRAGSRQRNAEGVMLKHYESAYHAGRKKGDWWKWKVDPLTIDAVMIYAQRGSGRRSAHYTDYTFAVRDGDKLVTIAKAYSGLPNKEIVEISRFVRDNAIEKFGPVRTVKPELVFEIAFEGIGLSSRHKSGVALRFPRISRWRKDKRPHDIDTIESVKSLIK